MVDSPAVLLATQKAGSEALARLGTDSSRYRSYEVGRFGHQMGTAP